MLRCRGCCLIHDIHTYTHTCMHTQSRIYQLMNRNLKMIRNQSETIANDLGPQIFKQFKQFSLKRSQTISNDSNNTKRFKQFDNTSNSQTISNNSETISNNSNDSEVATGATAVKHATGCWESAGQGYGLDCHCHGWHCRTEPCT